MTALVFYFILLAKIQDKVITPVWGFFQLIYEFIIFE